MRMRAGMDVPAVDPVPPEAVSRIEAVQRRRDVRGLRRLSQEQRRQRRESREREIARRMVGRFFGGEAVHLVVLDYRYWLARRCGWDALSPAWRDTGANSADGKPILYHPLASPFWLWWAGSDGLHYTQREMFARLSPHGLRRSFKSSNSLPSPTYLLIQRELASL